MVNDIINYFFAPTLCDVFKCLVYWFVTYFVVPKETFTKLEGGDRQKAMKRLRVPPLSAQVRDRIFFILCLCETCKLT